MRVQKEGPKQKSRGHDYGHRRTARIGGEGCIISEGAHFYNTRPAPAVTLCTDEGNGEDEELNIEGYVGGIINIKKITFLTFLAEKYYSLHS